jgi:hypothetical protein
MNKKWRYALLIFMMVLWICIKLLKLYFHTEYTKEEIKGWFEPITSKYGIKIVYEIGDDFFSPLENPPIPAGPGRNSIVTPIRHRVLARYPDLLQTALKKYPVEVIKKYLNAIQFAGEIEAEGVPSYWGTYDPFRRIIYLVDNGTKNDDQSMGTFHHEFSSLLLKSHSFFINPWTDHNPKNFEYFRDIYDDFETMEKNRDVITDYNEMGMVTNYGLTSFENDFNEYASMIFTYPQKFKKIMNQYPRVRGKFLVWLKFYQRIDPIFTEEYLLGN